MNGFRGDYTQLEWLQIGVFLIGLPIAAVMGAMLGLVGKWKQGRVMSAALVGLGGAAVTSIVLFLVFITLDIAGPKLGSGIWLMFFDTYMSWRYTTIAVIATASVALLGAIGFRARESKQAVYAISMRQILLLQLYAFIALGCWSGMRFFALSKCSDFQRARHHWGKQEWTVFGTEERGPHGLQRDFSGSSTAADWDFENAALRRAIAEPWLKEIHLYGLQANSAIEMSKFAESEQLESVALGYETGAVPPQTHLDAIGNVSSLQQLFLFGGDLRGLDLSPLVRRDSLKMLMVRGAVVDSARLKQVTRGSGLAQFEIHSSPSINSKWSQVTFQAGEFNITADMPIAPVDLDWVNSKSITHLDLRAPKLTTEAAKAIRALPNLDELELHCQIDAPALREIASHTSLRRLCLDREMVHDSEFEVAYSKLLLMPSLLILDEGSSSPRPRFTQDNDEGSRSKGNLTFRDGAQVNRDREKLGLKALHFNPEPEVRRRLLGSAPGSD